MSVQVKQTVVRVNSNPATLESLKSKLEQGCMVVNVTPINIGNDTYCVDYVLEYVVEKPSPRERIIVTPDVDIKGTIRP